jgi:tetratricopeptide (TPR) repeat protein/DNA-binding SARP family transcriptional activator
VEFRVLGPVEVWAGGRSHELGSRQERCVLAILLWELGRPIAPENVMERLWGNDRPAKALDSLYSLVSRLRGNLREASGGSDGWVPKSGWYRLLAERGDVDLCQFRDLRDGARAALEAGANDQALALLNKAERLWHGVPLADLDGRWVEDARVSLNEERYEATVMRMEATLRLGHDTGAVGDLFALTARYPLREAPTRLLMLALYRSGRSADALQLFPRFHRNYVEEMGGSESSGALGHLHSLMLRDDPELALLQPAPPNMSPASRAATVSAAAVAEVAPVHNLPRDNPDFTGRASELKKLAHWMNSEQAESTVPVIMISGMPGVGKTTLAVHAARVSGNRYSEQFFVELHSPDGEPVKPATALGTLLQGLGVSERVIPASVEDRVTLWRSRLAGKRALVILDDAAGSAQVRPLLPGAPGCLVLITTRRKAVDLPGMRWLPLEPFPPAEAAELFTRTAGEGRRDDEADVAVVLRLCGYLPQEIHFAASELLRHPAWSVAELATRLRESPAEDREVGAGLELTYRHLTATPQRLLRQLALHPGPGFSQYAAAALAGSESLSETRRSLDVLLDYHLIEETVSGRYVFRDLVWKYARRLANDRDSAADRDSAMDRLLDYYLYFADRADRLMYPFHRRIPVAVRHVPASTPPLATRGDCRKQMEAERPSMLAIARHAAALGRGEQAGLLAHALAGFLDTWGCWAEAGDLHRLAISAWRAMRNTSGEAKALIELSLVLGRMGHHEEALRHASDALVLARAAADRAAEAHALDRMGNFLWWQARYPEALARFNEALSIWRALGDEDGEADTLMYSGIVAWHLSMYPDAMRRTERALSLYRQLGNTQGEANALNNLGELQQEAGDYDQALGSYQHAFDMYKDLGDRQGEAIAVNNIGNVYRHTGRTEDALACYRSALDIYRDIGDLRCEADTLNNMGTAYLRMGRHGDALEQHHKALVLAHQLAERYLKAESLNGSGNARLAASSYSAAADDFRTAIEVCKQIGDRSQEAEALAGLGDALLHVSGKESAQGYWFSALTIFEDIGKPTAADAVRTRLRMGGVRARLSAPGEGTE